MLVRIDDSWSLEFEQDGAYIEFASVSVPGAECASVSVFLNNELVDRVNTSVPHSWWKNAGQQIIPRNPMAGDVVRIETDQPVDLRVDVIYP